MRVPAQGCEAVGEPQRPCAPAPDRRPQRSGAPVGAARPPHPEGDLLGLLGLLYGATTEPARWRDFLAAVVALLGGSSGAINFWDRRHHGLEFNVLWGVDEAKLALFERLAEGDPLVQELVARPRPAPFTCRMVLPEAVIRESRIYRELLAPEGIEHRLLVEFSATPDSLTVLCVMRGPDAAAFAAPDLDLARSLLPHLRRAFELYRRLARLETDLGGALATVEALDVGVVLIDRFGTCLRANREASSILAAGDGLYRDGERIRCRDPDADRALARFIEEAVAAAERGVRIPGQGLAAERATAAPPYSLLVSPLRTIEVAPAVRAFGGPVATLLISDPARELDLPGEYLRRRFGLTPAERRIVERLLCGASASEIAEHAGVRHDTVRAHLQRIYAKTRSRNRVELVRVLLASCGWQRAGKR